MIEVEERYLDRLSALPIQLSIIESGKCMRELSPLETCQVSGAKSNNDSAEFAELTSGNKNTLLINKLFRVLNGLFGMKLPYLK